MTRPIEGLCVYYNPDGGVCEFKSVIRAEIRSLKTAEAAFPRLRIDRSDIGKLVQKSESMPSASHLAEVADMALCNARGFAGRITQQIIDNQTKCDCYRKMMA
jgi:hypothetical protein